MNPVVFELSIIELRAYTAWLIGGMLLALGIIVWRAYYTDPAAVTRWVDVGIAGVIGGVIGARALHVVLTWDYFSEHFNEIDKIKLGGMAWHGALLTGIPAIIVLARLRRVPLRAWSDALALAWPVGVITAWGGCRRAGCGYGREVATLADYPGWLVEELPDIYGLLAPRFELQVVGMAWGGVLLGVALLMTWRGWLPGLRLWVILALTGFGLALIGFFRNDPAPLFYGWRVDQVLDLVVLLFGVMLGGRLWQIDRRARLDSADLAPAVETIAPAQSSTLEEDTHENHTRPGPDQS